jgi:uncharacterized protein
VNAQHSERGRKCPICGKASAESVKPFCSSRCADVDLNRWLGGVYRIETEEEPKGVEDNPGPRGGERN